MTDTIFTKEELDTAILQDSYADDEYSHALDAIVDEDHEGVKITIQGAIRDVELIGLKYEYESIEIVIQIAGDDRYFLFTSHYHEQFGADWENVHSSAEVELHEVVTTTWSKL